MQIQPQKLKIMKNFIKNSLLIFGVTCINFLIIEIIMSLLGYQVYDEFKGISAGGITKIVPGAGLSYFPNTVNKLHSYPGNLGTDGTGFIHNGTARSDNDLEGAIFVFGGSTVEGRGASGNEMTIPAQIEKCLTTETKKKVVVNAGYSGDVSWQELQRAVGVVMARYNPSMLIFLDGRNDAYYVQRNDWKPFDSNPGIVGPFTFVNDKIKQGPWQRLLHEARAISRLVNFIFQFKATDSESAMKYENPTESKTSYAVNAYLANHNGILAIGNKMEVPVFHFLQPTLSIGDKKINSIEFDKMSDFLKSESIDKSIYYYENIRSFYSKVKAEKQSTLIDLSNVFNGIEEILYVDSVHYNDRGNKIIADAMCRNITRNSGHGINR